MMSRKLMIGMVGLSVAVGAHAGDLVQSRGYNNCAEQIEKKLKQQRPKVSEAFYLSKSEEHLAFYLNATAWQDGERQSYRSKCLTSTSGHSVIAVNLETGRFDGAPRIEEEMDLSSRQ